MSRDHRKLKVFAMAPCLEKRGMLVPMRRLVVVLFLGLGALWGVTACSEGFAGRGGGGLEREEDAGARREGDEAREKDDDDARAGVDAGQGGVSAGEEMPPIADGPSDDDEPSARVFGPRSVPDLSCQGSTSRLRGSVGGVMLAETYTEHPGTRSVATYTVRGMNGGFLAYRADDGRMTGVLRVPPTGPAAGELWCVDEGSAIEEAESGTFGLTFGANGHPLGGCPGEPAEGELYACFETAIDKAVCDDSSPERRGFGGSIDGIELDEPFSRSLLGAGIGVLQLGSYQLVLRPEDGDPHSYDSAVLLAPPTGDLAREVICIGSATLEQEQGDGLVQRYTFSDLSRLGRCADGGPVETLDGCVR